MQYHLAADIGSSSGRLIVGWREGGTLQTQEIHRFANGMVEKNGQLCWNVEKILHGIKTGIAKATEAGKPPASVGVDTWGVDFVLLDAQKNMLGNAVAYRDHRTAGMIEKAHAIIPEAALFARTGVLSQSHNSMFQLMAVQAQQPDLLERAAHFLMLPDYFHFLLCGEMANEYTIATTTGLVNAHTRKWDYEIIERLGFPAHLFREIMPTGTRIGAASPTCDVITPPGHDTACAVVMAQKDAIYISSGTWSLVGITSPAPILSEEGRVARFSNEGGYGGFFCRDNRAAITRYCKNSMGLFMIQCVRSELENAYDFPTLCEMAEAADIESIINSDDMRFFSPANMIGEIKNACEESNQPVPQTAGEIA
ncbi:MAG: FGGY family carbohydrate kinase, partial [Defluviitaleaceae bacterium]|nr:FGGY family carbohydrate kinase [Defluviitaleaceae bacterium]